MSIAAVIAGAGSGTRLGANMPKALVWLSGEPLIVHAVRGMNDAGVTDVVITIPDHYEQEFAHALARAGLTARLVPGGATRQESVARGLAAVDADYVLVHDAARPLTPPAVITRVIDALRSGHPAVVPALPVTDTVKEILRPGELEQVARTLDRAQLRAMQTPQGFTTELLRRAHAAGEKLSASEQSAAPDDAALVELLGETVVLVAGSQEAMKVTTAFDLQVAELIGANDSEKDD